MDKDQGANPQWANTMYEKYFGFVDLPFRVTPEPRYFYSNPVYQEALATLRYGIEARKGFIVITGEVGTGKTTLLKIFMRGAETIIHTAFVFNPTFSITKLLRFILTDLGVKPSGGDKSALMAQLNEYLIQQLKNGHIVALLLDEAQQLSDEMLEELRLLSNFETDEDKLIQIVLMGQPELEERLNRPELRQLKQRVTLRCRLAPLNGQDIHQYIDFRLRTAGYQGGELFDQKAIEKIAAYSMGIPRLINVICDNALLTAYATAKDKVSGEIIEEVGMDLQLTVPRQSATSVPSAKPGIVEHEDRPRGKEGRLLNWSFKEFFTEFRFDKSFAGSRTAALLGLLLLAVGGLALYHQSSRDYLSHVAGDAKDFVDMRLETLQQAKWTPTTVEEVSHGKWPAYRGSPASRVSAKQTTQNPGPGQTREVDEEKPIHSKKAQAEEQKADVRPTAGSSKPAERTVMPSSGKHAQSRLDEPAARRPQLPDSQRSFLTSKAPDPCSRLSASKAQRLFPGHFEVTKDSVIFDKPSSQAAVVATLPPRTWVRIEENLGNYVRVRSLNDPDIRGYVRAEDAFFQYIGFARQE
jgi:general secretion pathway protein A